MPHARGVLLGLAVGDALGTTYEFAAAAQVQATLREQPIRMEGGGPFALRAGQVTDDTELALALAGALLDARGWDADVVARAYADWAASGPFDIGNTCAKAFASATLRPEQPGVAERMAAAASTTSEANGALMRVAPLGVWGWHLGAKQLAAIAVEDAQLSHPHPRCQAASALLAVVIAACVRHGGGRAVAMEAVSDALELPECALLADDVAEALGGGELPAVDGANMGWVRHALRLALRQLSVGAELEEGLTAVIGCGGDTDTNAAITGALLGAVYGDAGIPARWVSAVRDCDSPRPEPYHAAQIGQLAERLAALAQGDAIPLTDPAD